MNRGIFPKLDVFITGEFVDLGVPTSKFAECSHWCKCLNNKSCEIATSTSIEISKENDNIIMHNRGGNVWGGFAGIRQKIKPLAKNTYLETLTNFYEAARSNYYSKIFSF